MSGTSSALLEPQSVDVFETRSTAQDLLMRLRAFFFPGGEESGRRIKGIKTTELGEMRASPQAHWISFTAEQTIEATRTSFRWDARLSTGKIVPVVVTDAYERGHGRLVARVGPVATQKVVGPDADQGELQRYLASIIFCPPMMLNNRSLELTAVGPQTLRVRARDDRTDATVDVEISQTGQPLSCRANRPRLVGKRAILTPWMGVCSDFKEVEGLSIPQRLEVTWLLPEGLFTYYRSEAKTFTLLR